ncbi:amidase [Paenibacillus sp. LMG 31459]|uniref:Amidase n=1 Tax=Paenibacillus phytohabitans TaxID=2654978 RepID=A0ABX1YJ22_9BACL|nr:amidase [Paenibacillus phytohabitans]NOU81047.1 amidase [Paenibacillus phytohabitans]
MLLNRSSLIEMMNGTGEPEVRLERSLDLYMERFGQLEPQIRAFVPEADAELRLGREKALLLHTYSEADSKPALFGVPVAVKDLLHVEGLPTRAGSQLPADLLTGPEGSLVLRLRFLGALIAGKTVTEEFAYNGPIATRNPHNTAHTPGGSSAGSAAAVAAGICPLAVGTQTLRSVIAPASFCGVVGFKPSYGRVPLDGVLLLSPSFDTIGFFTQDLPGMEAAAALLVPDWEAIPAISARKPVLGVPAGVYMELMSPEVKAVFIAQIGILEQLGYQVRHVDMPWKDEFIYGDAMIRFIEGELAREHEHWFAEHREEYGLPVQEAILRGRQITDEELEQYRGQQMILRRDLKELMVQEGIDLWVSPAQGGTAPKVEENNTGWAGMAAIWGFAGSPSISLPAATIGSMPLGFQCIGTYGEDETLLAWARELWPHIAYNSAEA